jgi:alkanesulfonate monooxygenase SsuD/methylene tetrahydromethanopterin reductase-like flavin-dependent oxidoreductase (luciferase family)
MRRVARIGQGWFSFNRLPGDLPEPLARLDTVLGEHDRSRDDIVLTVCPYFNPVTPEMVEQYAAGGVDRLVVLCLAFDLDTLNSQLDDLVATVLTPAQSLT